MKSNFYRVETRVSADNVAKTLKSGLGIIRAYEIAQERLIGLVGGGIGVTEVPVSFNEKCLKDRNLLMYRLFKQVRDILKKQVPDSYFKVDVVA